MNASEFIDRIARSEPFTARGGILSDLTLTHQNIIGGTYRDFVFDNVNFARINFAKSQFVNCGFYGFFHKCNFDQAVFRKCTIVNTDMLSVSLNGTVFEKCEIHYVDFGKSDLSQATFINCTVGRIWPEDKRHWVE